MALSNTQTFKHLKITKSSCYKKYLENTRIWGEVGNEAFAAHVHSTKNNTLTTPEEKNSDLSTYLLYHSWLPEMMQLTSEQAASMQMLINGIDESDMTAEQKQWAAVLTQAHWLDDTSVDIDILVNRALQQIIAIQNRYEITEYLKIIQQKKPKVIVEIGTARGGMLYCLCQLAAPDALIISIDEPGAPNCGGQTDIERQFYSSFISPGQRIEFIPANSHFHTTLMQLEKLLDNKKVDVLFIDGDHSYGGVKIDFEMYSPFAADDGLITFHDIRLIPKYWGSGNEVGVFWDEISKQYEVTEIVDPNGICKPIRPRGVEPCWGIGILGNRLKESHT